MDSKGALALFVLVFVIKETKTNKSQCPLSSVRVQDPQRQSKRNQNDYGGKDEV